jgi:hypothetical protein
MLLTQEELKKHLTYCPKTGLFTWIKTGKPASQNPNKSGYLRVRVAGRLYYAHRLAWLYMTGEWPDGDIDHINERKNDNRMLNLRACSRSENKQNVSLTKSNTSGTKGVGWAAREQKWRARIQHNGKDVHLGYFSTKKDAISAIREARLLLHGEFANHG